MFRTHGNPGYEEGSSCDQCKKGPARPEFYSQTSTYYRNKASGHYYFCGDACQEAFNATRKCIRCGYGHDLEDTGKGYVLCTDFPYDFSCYDRWKKEGKCENKYKEMFQKMLDFFDERDLWDDLQEFSKED